MKRRRKPRQNSWSSIRQPLAVFSRAKRQRKSFTFERLEDRFAFSATSPDTGALSSNTPEGAAAILARELQWAAMQNANATVQADAQYTTYALPSDPMFQHQWHLLNTGQDTGSPDFPQPLYGVAGEDINVVPAWNMGYTGEGVVVAVIDTGVQLFHPDLQENIHPSLRLNAIFGTSNVNPSLVDPGAFHGTAVAGIIGAASNNEEGGTGVAPNATIVPILVGLGPFSPISPFQFETAFQYVTQNDIDITNNSWGPNHATSRFALPMSPTELEILRDSVIFGRDGLGVIHIFASGNDAGPFLSPAFENVGNFGSASYNPWVNSRYTIGVTGVDEGGDYATVPPGTFTSYPTAGPSVLVAAPTGSNAANNIGDDNGQGSGIWTTDLVGDFGRNAAPLPSGLEDDRDFYPNPDYTSRMNGTSASAPMVAGVVALMLEANPNLTYRDVQEILVRSSRQNAQFEFPSTSALSGPPLWGTGAQNTWQVNQIGPFRNPDDWSLGFGPFASQFDPLADPNKDVPLFGPELDALDPLLRFNMFGPDTNDSTRQVLSYYEPQPAMFANGAGYTVSQGYGIYGEQIGYAHGVVDAELAVQMALQWHTLGQNMDRLTEATTTTAVVLPNANIPAAEKTTPPPDGPALIVPGGIGGLSGYIAYWNEYWTDDPFNMYTGPYHTQRGLSYIDFAVAPSQAIDVEWVEVRIDISGGTPDNLDFLRIMLTSPEGTQSELNHFYLDSDVAAPVFSLQDYAAPAWDVNPIGEIDIDGGTFVWTFSTNRHWGESSNSAVLIHPITGEPLMADVFDPDDPNFPPSPYQQPMFRNWEVHIENWSDSSFGLEGIEVVFHGKSIEGGQYDPNYAHLGIAQAQRVQGFIGLDTNNDEEFNYNRYVQSLDGTHTDVNTIRLHDVTRQLDFNDNNVNGIYDAGDTINQEPFAENILVEAYRVMNGVVESSPTAQFLTGADGNYYFDLDPTFEYEIRVSDPLGRQALDDNDTAAGYQRHYQSSWRITPDWFYAPDRDNPLLLTGQPGEIFFGMNDNNGDGVATMSPQAFTGYQFSPNTGAQIPPVDPVPMAVKNINFLLKQDAPVNQFEVQGTVFADLNGNGTFDGDDARAAGVVVYWDVDRDGTADAGEQRVTTDANGNYSMIIDLTTLPVVPTGNATYQIGVIPPTNEWIPTDPGADAVETVFAGPGSPTQTVNFFLDPPDSAFPPNNNNQLGSILGVVYNDLDDDGVRDAGEGGLSNIRVFIDANENGVWDSATESSTLTSNNGSYFFADVAPGLIRIDVHITNEGTAAAAWAVTAPAIGYREVALGPGGTVTSVNFGLDNRADHDWGDLPDSYATTAANNGPRHAFIPGFRLGSSIDGEVNGIPTPGANGDDSVGDTDDGIRVISNGGILQPGVNLVEVTVSGFGGVLSGWIDWNKDGQFSAGERINWRNAAGVSMGTEADLVQGTYTMQIVAPGNMQNGPLAARFRWGEPGLSFTGPAIIGEVEDYFLSASNVPITGLAGDYNNDRMVDLADYVVWRRHLNTNITLPNDTTPGTVRQEDYAVWSANYGATIPGAGAGGGSGQLAAEVSAEPAAPAEPGASLVADGASSSDDVPAEAPLLDSSAVGSLLVDSSFSSRFSTASGLVQFGAGTPAAAESDADLLLLDQAIAELSDDDEAPLSDRFGHDDEVGELELASVFENESHWWGI